MPMEAILVLCSYLVQASAYSDDGIIKAVRSGGDLT